MKEKYNSYLYSHYDITVKDILFDDDTNVNEILYSLEDLLQEQKNIIHAILCLVNDPADEIDKADLFEKLNEIQSHIVSLQEDLQAELQAELT